jgi:hypothetical protein
MKEICVYLLTTGKTIDANPIKTITNHKFVIIGTKKTRSVIT